MDKQKKNIVIGAVIGGIVGLGVVSLFCSKKCKKTRVSKALCHLGDIFDKGAQQGEDLLETAEDSMDKGEGVLSNVMDWAATGLQLWNKIKKGV